MADLYSTIGQNARKVLTVSDVTGGETTWLMVENSDGTFEAGADENPALTTANSVNAQVIRAIAQRCEIYEVVRANSSELSIQVRTSSVPYDSDDAPSDGGSNTILTNEVRTALGGNTAFTVWNGSWNGNNLSYD